MEKADRKAPHPSCLAAGGCVEPNQTYTGLYVAGHIKLFDVPTLVLEVLS